MSSKSAFTSTLTLPRDQSCVRSFQKGNDSRSFPNKKEQLVRSKITKRNDSRSKFQRNRSLERVPVLGTDTTLLEAPEKIQTSKNTIAYLTSNLEVSLLPSLQTP